MALLRSILILVVAVVLASCQTLTAPPGFASSGSGTAGRIEFPDGVSLEAQYSLLTWYEEEHGVVANRQAADVYGVALNARNERGALLRGNGARSLVLRFPDFAYIPRQDGIAFYCEKLGKRGDYAEMDAMLAMCQEVLQAPRSVEVPVAECAAFLASYADAKEVALFQAWAAQHKRLELGGQDAGSLKALRLCREALSLKAELTEGMASARKIFEAGGQDSEYLDALSELAKRIGNTRDFGVIGDYDTIQDFRKMYAEGPADCVERVLVLVSDAKEKVMYESLMSKSLSIWEKDERFQKVLVQECERIRSAVMGLFEVEMALIQGMPERTKESRGYWGNISWCRGMQEALRANRVGAWDCYVRYGLAEKLIAALNDAVEEMRGPAVELYFQTQTKIADRFDRQAVVVALHGMLAELCDDSDQKLVISEERKNAALSRLQQHEPLCSMAVAELSSEISQVSGAVWTKDLRCALEDKIKRYSAEKLWSLTEDSSIADYVLSEGELLEFTGDALETRSETRSHRWYTDPRLEESPQGLVFVQELFEEQISTKSSTRSGHVRARAKIAGEGVENTQEEFSGFYSKEFVQEEVLSTKKIRSVHCEDERQTMAPGAPVRLREERVWSAAEMMDFCRQSMLEEWTEDILCHLFEAQCRVGEPTEMVGFDYAELQGELLNVLNQCQFVEGSSLEKQRQECLELLPEKIRHAIEGALMQGGSMEAL